MVIIYNDKIWVGLIVVLVIEYFYVYWYFFCFFVFLVEIMKFKIYKVNYKVLLIDIEMFSWNCVLG